MVSCPHYVPLCSGSISHSIPLFPILSHAIHAIPLYSKYCISHYFWYVPFSPHDLPDILRRSTTAQYGPWSNDRTTSLLRWGRTPG